MVNEEIITRLNSMKDYYNDRREPYYVGFDYVDNEALDMAIKAVEKIEKIRNIIDIDNSVIQEDVLKYKMICEVMKDK